MDLRVLPARSPLAGGGRGRASDDVSECVPQPQPGNPPEVRLGVAPADRPQRLLCPAALGESPRQARARPGCHGHRGDGRSSRRPAGGPYGPHCRARRHAGAAANGDPSTRVARPLLRRDRHRARDDAISCGDVDLPRAALAGSRARESREAEGPPVALRVRPRRDRHGDQGLPRRERRRQDGRCDHGRGGDDGNGGRHRSCRRLARHAHAERGAGSRSGLRAIREFASSRRRSDVTPARAARAPADGATGPHAAPRERGRAFGQATAAAAKAKSKTNNGNSKGKAHAPGQVKKTEATQNGSQGQGASAGGRVRATGQGGPPPHAQAKALKKDSKRTKSSG